MTPSPGSITRLLVDWRDGDKAALDRLIPLVYEELLALDDALKDLAAIDPRKSQVVELRYFGGLSVDETAEVIGVSSVTVMREWRSAKGWLLKAITKSEK